MNAWEWLIYSEQGLIVRIVFGAAVFLGLAASELAKKGRQAKRWREYLFLLAGVGAAMLYGMVNDQITFTLSPDFFLYGKGIGETLDVATASQWQLRWEAAKIGFQATWSAGLVIAAAILIANNPRKSRVQLSYRDLLGRLPALFVFAASFACVLGLAGFVLMNVSAASRFIVERFGLDFLPGPRQAKFVCVYGVHLGGYIGGIIGTVASIAWIVRVRRAQSAGGGEKSPL